MQPRKKGSLFFNSLPDEVRAQLEARMKSFVFQKKQIIHREGFMPTGLFIIRKGKVKIYRIPDSSREIIIHIAGEGEMLGYSALIRQSDYHSWAEAIERTELGFLPRKVFYEFMETHPAFAMKLMKELAQQFDAVMDKMVMISTDQVRKRTAKTLLWMMQTHGLDDDNKTIRLSLSRQDMAHLVATNTETLVRTLSELSREKTIELKRKKIAVVDVEKLHLIAHAL